MIEPRPQSIAEIASRADSKRRLSYELQDFLHEFERRQDPAMLQEEPELLAERLEDGGLGDAFLAATAASLADRLRVRRPGWTYGERRFLHAPWFAVPGLAMRACLLLESPGPFRERNIFVTANALSVA